MELLSTSGIVLLVCVLAGLYLVSRRTKPQGTATIGAEKYAADVMEEAPEPTSPERSLESVQTLTARSEGSPWTGFVPRWGRLAIFSLACLALFLALVTGLMSLWASASFAFPLFCLLVATGSLTFLRVLAVRDRDRRRARTALTVEKARKAHRPSGRQGAESSVNPLSHPETSSIELRPAPERPARARQQMPVSHAAKALRKARTQTPATALRPSLAPAAQRDTELTPRLRMDEALPDTSWQITEVPRPTYLDAPTAHRELPTVNESEPEQLSQTKTLAEAASLNLDDVLRRRRA
ncbi:hypothetical protein ACN08Y_00270 [Rothia sp. P5764]|uniref:hypothetical protein n=1 Tax=Rothia sp. P5764 TaxID=3402654 RepID=UPI003AC6A721